MCHSVQQVLADSIGAPGTPKATSDAATSDLEPLPLHLVTELGHPGEDRARLETKLQKLLAQVSSPCCPTLALKHSTPEHTPGPSQAQ